MISGAKNPQSTDEGKCTRTTLLSRSRKEAEWTIKDESMYDDFGSDVFINTIADYLLPHFQSWLKENGGPQK